MHKSLIKGDEVRFGNLIMLDALSKEVIESIKDEPLSEKLLTLLHDGSIPITPMTTKQLMESYKSSGDVRFAVRLLNDKSCIGSCRLDHIDWKSRHAQLLIGIVNDAHYTVELLIDVIQTVLQFVYWEANLNRIYVHCVADNVILREVLEQAGFTNEGQLRQEVYRNGRYLNKIVFSILQREWSG